MDDWDKVPSFDAGEAPRRSTSSLGVANVATVVASIGLGVVVLLNLVATAFIARSQFETPRQKLLQLIFAWAVPLVGSVIIIAVLKATRPERERRFDAGSLGNSWLPGIGPESENAHGHHGTHGEGSGDSGHGGDAGFGGH
jgi:hypothetical protein